MMIKRLINLEKYKDYITLLYTKYSQYSCTLNLVTPLLIFLGFSALSIALYIRFLRERLPKDIPFALYEYSFFILVGICCIYAYVIFRLLIPQKTIHPLMLKGLYLMFLPIYNLDAFIKYNRYIYPYYFKLFSSACKILDDWYFKHLLRAIYILQILPRLILVSIFIIDIFYFAQLKLIYSFIYIGILPLLYAYIKYSIVVALEAYIQQLESQYTRVAMLEKDNPLPKDASAPPAPHNDYGIYTQEEFETLLYEHRVLYGVQNPNAIYHEEEVSIRRYIEIQYETWYNYDPKDETTHYEYTGSPYPQEEVYTTYRKNNNKVGWSYVLYISLDSLQDLPRLKKVLEILAEYIKLYRNGGRRII